MVLADPAANRRRIEEAVVLARDSDVAVVVVGDNEQTAREAYAEDDHALRALHGPAPHHEVDDGAGGYARAAHEEREERHQAEHQRESRAHRQELPRPRHLTKASGWMSLASDSMPSTTRGP